jgi:Mu transposase, C-terminal
MPDSLEQPELLLLAFAGARKIHPDGMRFQGPRYVDLTLVAYVGETVHLEILRRCRTVLKSQTALPRSPRFKGSDAALVQSWYLRYFCGNR